MKTSSRRLGQRFRNQRPSHTPGKTKGENCQKSPLKTWGMHVNPYKLGISGQHRYAEYCALTDIANKMK